MMGVWHTEALKETDCQLYMAVGRREEPLVQFSTKYGYRSWTTDFAAALADNNVDVVILANPSELHAQTALASIAAGKHVLVEIPIAMTLLDAERVVSAAESRGVLLGVVHPLRFRSEMVSLRARIQAGEEEIHQVCGRFFIRRLQNVGATGYRRSWTDNLLWHHMAHLVDFGCWMFDRQPQGIQSVMPAPDPRTGIPMDCVITVQMTHGASIVAIGSYLGHEGLYETLVTTDRDSYRVDILKNVLVSREGPTPIASEQQNCALVARDFLAAVRDRRAPASPGASVLPAMRILQEVQNQWDARFGPRPLPGRP